MERDLADDDGAEATRRRRDPRNDFPFSNRRPEIDYKVYTTKFDEVVRAEDLCDNAELDRLRGFLDKQIAPPAGRRGAARERLQRRLMAQQNRSWEFDQEEGWLDTARLTRVVIDPMQPLASSASATPIPRHRG